VVADSNTQSQDRGCSSVGLFPLPNVVLFPAQQLSLHVFEPRYRKLVNDVLEKGSQLALPRLEPGYDSDYYGAPPVLATCGIGRIIEYARLPNGRFNIVVLGLGRVRIVEELRSEPYRVARVQMLSDILHSQPMVAETLRTELLKLVRRTAPHLSGPAKELEGRLRGAAHAGECADIAAGTLIEDPDERQALLEELDPTRRLTTLIAHLHLSSSRLPGAEVVAPQRMN
jgi:Lon protease-like protein